MDINKLTESDVTDAHVLSRQAGWGFRERDWRRFLTMASVDAFAGRLNNELIATATVIHYNPHSTTGNSRSVAWIGSILVDKSYRRQGYGTEIFETALSHASSAGAIVGLDANKIGEPIYVNAGFVTVAEVTQWSGPITTTGSAKEVEECSDPSEIFELDAQAVDVDRSALLRRFWENPTSFGFIQRESDEVTGYVLVRPSLNGWTVGPLVSNEPETVHDLIAAVEDVTGDDKVTLNVAGNPGVAKYYRDAGLDHVRTLSRMTYGQQQKPLLGKLVRAIPGFAYG